MTRNMKCAAAIAGIAILVTVFWVAPALAAVDMFIKIEGIDGESSDKDHSGWIDVESFSWSSPVRPLSAGGGGGRRGQSEAAVPGSLTITKFSDQASTFLMQACSNGRNLGEVVIDLVSTDDRTQYVEYTLYRLSDVYLTSCGSSGEGDRPTESVTLNYSKLEYDYVPVGRGRGRGGSATTDPYAVNSASEGLVAGPVAPPAGSAVRTAGYAFPGGTITGLVLAPSERTVANVPISVGTISGVVIETQTDDIGRFVVDVPPDADGELTVSATDIATGLASPAVMEVVTRVPTDIRSEPKPLIAAGDVVDLVGHFSEVTLVDPAALGRAGDVVVTAPAVGFPNTLTSADILADTGRLDLPTVTSVGPGGTPAITRYSVPPSIPPAELVTVMTDSDGNALRFDTTTYTTTGHIDSNQLRSGQATDFTFDFQFPPGPPREVGVSVIVTGAVTYEQSGQLQQLHVDADGSAQLVGTVNATAATPGGLPFSITPTVVP